MAVPRMGAQYSSLHQIDRSNVDKLKKVWTYQTEDDLPYAFNPLVVDDVMYVMARTNSIVALDATTGKEIWTHPIGAKTTLMTNRGIDYWEKARIALNGACSLPPTTSCRQLTHGPDKPSLTSARVVARTSARGLDAIPRR
jgi:glucose dehydrogenase